MYSPSKNFNWTISLLRLPAICYVTLRGCSNFHSSSPSSHFHYFSPNTIILHWSNEYETLKARVSFWGILRYVIRVIISEVSKDHGAFTNMYIDLWHSEISGSVSSTTLRSVPQELMQYHSDQLHIPPTVSKLYKISLRLSWNHNLLLYSQQLAKLQTPSIFFEDPF